MDNQLAVTKVTNPFNKADGRERFSLVPQKVFTIRDLLEYCHIPIQNASHFNVVVNTHICNDLNKVLFPGDSIVIVAKLQIGGGGEGGGKDLVGTVAMLAVMLTAAVAAPAVGGWMAMNMSMGLMNTTWTAIAAGTMILGGSLIVSSLLPAPHAELLSAGGNLGIGNSEYEGSPAYGFAGGQTSYVPGLPYPVLYGKYQLSGQMINFWIETNNNDFSQVLKGLICMSEGLCQFPATEKSQIKVNDVGLDSLGAVSFESTKGGYDQEAIQIGGFDKLHQYKPVSYELDSGPYILLHGDEDPLTDSSYWEHTMAITSVVRSNVQSKFGGYSMLFDAATDFLGWTENQHLHFEWNRDMTVTFWLWMTTQDGSHRNIFSQWYNSYNNLKIGFYNSNKLMFYFLSGASERAWVESKADLATGQWYYVELTKIGDWYYLFLDGELQEKVLDTVAHTNYWTNLPAGCGLGRNSSWAMNSFLGYIEEFQMIGTPGHSSDYDVPMEAPSDTFGLTIPARGQADEISLNFEMPYGLYEINTSAVLVENEVSFAIHYRKKDSGGTWILRSAILGYLSGGTAEPSEGDIIEGATSGAKGEWVKYNETGGTWAGGDSSGNPTLLTNPGGIILKNVIDTFSVNELLNNVSTGDNNIATLEDTVAELIHGEHIIEKVRVPVRKAFAIESLDRDIYEVRILRIIAGEGDTQHVSNIFWTGFDAKLNEELNYPCLSLLAVSVKASERIQGQTPNFRAIWDRGSIEVSDWFPLHRDFSEYTEVDPNSHINLLDWRIDFDDLDTDEDAYLYKDMGVDCFDGDFKFYLECELTSAAASGMAFIFVLANLIDDCKGIHDVNDSFLGIYLLNAAGTYCLKIAEVDGENLYTDSQDISLNTKYYLTIYRDESVGTHGTFYMDIYTDEARKVLLASKTLTLHTSKKDFRYLYGLNTWNAGAGSQEVTGYSENLRAIREVESSNLAWACYDMFTNERYGEQVAPLNINQTNWLAWVAWCDGVVSRIQNFLYFNELDALQDYTGYTEVDAGTDIVINSVNKITFTALPANVISYVYKDFTVNYFGGDFNHRLKVNISGVSANDAFVGIWSLSNNVEDWNAAMAADHSFIGVYVWKSTGDSQLKLGLQETDGANDYFATAMADMIIETDYYLKVWRDESVGTYGTLYLAVYLDEAMKEQVGSTSSITLHTSKKDFQYLYGLRSKNMAVASTITGTVENLNISPIDIESDKITFTDVTTNEDAFVYKDFGEDYFNEDFEHKLTAKLTEGKHDTARVYFWALTNEIDDWYGLDVGSHNMLGLAIYQGPVNAVFALYECDGGTIYNDDSLTISADTSYYLTIKRDESIGTYGTLYCYIYTDAARTTLFDTLTLTLHSKTDFRYLFGLLSFNPGGNDALSGECSDMKISQKRITCNGVFDTQASVSAAIEKFNQYGRTMILKTGQKVDVVIEKPVDTEGELFSSGNIIEGTNEQEFIDLESRPDVMNIEFYDAAKNYEKSSVSIHSSDYDTLDRAPNIESLFIWGCTSEDGARRFGLLRMQMNEKLNRMTSHESDVDAIGCQVGDVIRKEHESDETTFGGDLGDQTDMNNFYVKLDQDIEIVADGEEEDHKIWIRYVSNTRVERYIRGPWDTETDDFYIGALENFEDDYTETDPNSHITVDGNDITFAGLTSNEDAYVYKDFGVAYFDGDFEHQIDGAKLSSLSGIGITHTFIWALTNDIDDWKGLDDGLKDSIGIAFHADFTTYKISLYENDGGAEYIDHYIFPTLNVPYYLTIKRDESVGTHGTLYCYIYSDEARTTLVDTLTLTLHTSKKDYRYLFGLLSYNSAVADSMTGEVKNINTNGLSGDQAEFDVFAIGKTEAYAVMLYRLLGLGRTVDTTFRLIALEYDEDIYSHSEYDGYI